MRCLLCGTVRTGGGAPLRYYLLEERGERTVYGILVARGRERVEIRDLGASRPRAASLLHALRRGRVTPVSAKDVAEDYLAAGCPLLRPAHRIR